MYNYRLANSITPALPEILSLLSVGEILIFSTAEWSYTCSVLTDGSGVVLTRAPAACQLLINIMSGLVFYYSLYCQVNLAEEVPGYQDWGLLTLLRVFTITPARDLPIVSEKRSIKFNHERKQRLG